MISIYPAVGKPPLAPFGIETSISPVEFGPIGTIFSEVANITIPYDETLLPVGITEERIEIFQLESTFPTTEWIYLPKSNHDVVNNVVSAIVLELKDPTSGIGSSRPLACAIQRDSAKENVPGELYCWGFSNAGALGTGPADLSRTSPGLVSAPGDLWLDVATSGQHTCGIKSDQKLYCWGNNSSGKLGIGCAQFEIGCPGAVFYPRPVSSNRLFKSVSTGSNHTCAIDTLGGLHCWGGGGNGELGLGDYASHSSPVAVSGGQDWAAIATGFAHTCGLKNNGIAYCWGFNAYGQLGQGLPAYATRGQNKPRVVSGVWKSIAAGQYATCGISTSNQLYCWGRNTASIPALGLGFAGPYDCLRTTPPSSNCATVPLRVGIESDWQHVSVSGNYGCATKISGQVYCWGINDFGKAGQDPVIENPLHLPKQEQTLATDWARVDTGAEYTCGRKTNGEVHCWGSNHPDPGIDWIPGLKLPATPCVAEPVPGFSPPALTYSNPNSIFVDDFADAGFLDGWVAANTGGLPDAQVIQQNGVVVMDTGVAALSPGAVQLRSNTTLAQGDYAVSVDMSFVNLSQGARIGASLNIGANVPLPSFAGHVLAFEIDNNVGQHEVVLATDAGPAIPIRNLPPGSLNPENKLTVQLIFNASNNELTGKIISNGVVVFNETVGGILWPSQPPSVELRVAAIEAGPGARTVLSVESVVASRSTAAPDKLYLSDLSPFQTSLFQYDGSTALGVPGIVFTNDPTGVDLTFVTGDQTAVPANGESNYNVALVEDVNGVLFTVITSLSQVQVASVPGVVSVDAFLQNVFTANGLGNNYSVNTCVLP